MDARLAAERFGVVDVETSGLLPDVDRIVQIGLVVVDAEGRVLERWSTRVRPWLTVWKAIGATEVHGIRRRDLLLAPSTRRAMSEFARRIAGTRIVAHNAPFDLSFLRAEATRAGVGIELRSPICTLRLSRSLDPDRHLRHGLSEVCARYGVELVHAHDALADAEAAAAVLPHLLRAHGVTSVDQLSMLPSAS